MDIQRWSHPEGSLAPNDTGSVVLFSDVEEALKDKAMLDWLLPIISGESGLEINQRIHTLGLGVTMQRSGRDLVAWAMRVHSGS